MTRRCCEVRDSERKQRNGFDTIQTLAQQHEMWIGARYEDKDPDSGGGDPTREEVKWRNGLVFIGPKGVELTFPCLVSKSIAFRDAPNSYFPYPERP